MIKKRHLLVEIVTEELPPKTLLNLSNAFTNAVSEGLKNANLGFAEVKSFASPRRLAVLIHDLDDTQADRKNERRGPAVTAAFDEEGVPTNAAIGFAKSAGVTVDELETLDTKSGNWLVARTTTKGKPTTELLPDIIKNSLDKLPTAKRMRWGSGEQQFVRPVHYLIILFGKEVIQTELYGIKSNKHTVGHRFHAPRVLSISKAEDYPHILEKKGKVIADFAQRKRLIHDQVCNIVKQKNLQAVIDAELLNEVTAMVEWPVAIMGTFDQKFLQVPAEALISTMKTNQKYFHTLDQDGKLAPYFITISNIKSKDEAKIREGNERVIRPRFSDAEFFWLQDQKTSLSSHLQPLKNVVFQKQLGTLYDKVQRIKNLAGSIAETLDIDVNLVQRAAELCKCDLMTEMVMEFPELQGVMGRYYAAHEGENEQVCTALDDYYCPRYSGDRLPANGIAQVLAIADKIDTLLGVFAIGQKPTGDKDPFALRRTTLGILRIIIECNLSLDIPAILKISADTFPREINAEKVINEVHQFMMDRLKAYYHDQHIDFSVFDSVVSQFKNNPADIHARIKAVDYFLKRPEAVSLSAANKRIANILKKVKGELPSVIDPEKFSSEAEASLYQQLEIVQQDINPLMEKLDYTATLQELSVLKNPVDDFFDQVMVMDENIDIRNNRLALLNMMQQLFLNVADISKLQAG